MHVKPLWTLTEGTFSYMPPNTRSYSLNSPTQKPGTSAKNKREISFSQLSPIIYFMIQWNVRQQETNKILKFHSLLCYIYIFHCSCKLRAVKIGRRCFLLRWVTLFCRQEHLEEILGATESKKTTRWVHSSTGSQSQVTIKPNIFNTHSSHTISSDESKGLTSTWLKEYLSMNTCISVPSITYSAGWGQSGQKPD